MAWPDDELPLAVELYDGSSWVDITSDVRAAEGANIVITRGQPDESSAPQPGSITATVANKTGKYSPRNPESTLYGKIGRNTPLRVKVTQSDVASDDQLRGIGEVSEWPPRWDVSGQDATTSVVAQGILRRLGQGANPTRSPLKSAVFTEQQRLTENSVSLVAYWPMEDGPNSTQFADAMADVPDVDITGSHTPMIYTGDRPDFASIGPLLGSDKIPTLGATTTLTGNVPAYTDPLGLFENAIRFIMDIPPSPSWTDGTPILHVYQSPTNSTTVDRWELRYRSGSGGDLELRALDASGTQLATSGSIDLNIIDKAQVFVGLTIELSAGDTLYSLFVRWIDDDGITLTEDGVYDQGFSTTLVTTRTTKVVIAPSGGLDDLAIGHMIVSADRRFANSIYLGDESQTGVVSFAGETAADRVDRLATERDISVTLIGESGDTQLMGPQAIPSTLIENLTETHEADMALLFETRGELGLSWRTRRDLYNQDPGATLDYDADGEIAPDLEPIDDDRYVRNDVTVARKNGSSARVVDATSRMGTQDPPDGVGVYDERVELNLYDDTRLADIAAWRVHVGTWDEARYPVVRINMTALAAAGKTDLVAQAAALDVGDRLRLKNLPVWTGADAVDLMCLAFRETFDYPNGWVIEVTTVPYGPYAIGSYATTPISSSTKRYDTLSSTLTNSVDAGTDTSFQVNIATGGALWTTKSASWVGLRVEAGGAIWSVTSITGTSSPQTINVTAATVNGVVKTVPIGTPVRVAPAQRATRGL